MATYHHVLARMGKEKATHSEMAVRFFNQVNLEQSGESDDIENHELHHLSPILTYGMEAFPFTSTEQAKPAPAPSL